MYKLGIYITYRKEGLPRKYFDYYLVDARNLAFSVIETNTQNEKFKYRKWKKKEMSKINLKNLNIFKVKNFDFMKFDVKFGNVCSLHALNCRWNKILKQNIYIDLCKVFKY